MSKQHEISEYIDKLSFKKKFGGGFEPDSVYEAVRELTSMYNDVLAESYQEMAELKETVTKQQQQINDMCSFARPQPKVAEPSPVIPPQREEVAPQLPQKDEKEEAEILKRMNRRKLLEVLLNSSRENESLNNDIRSLLQKNKQLQALLDEKTIKIEKAGTIAEAAFQINGVMESAKSAADQYLDNLQSLYERESVRCEQKESLAQAQAQKILDNAKSQCDALVLRTREQCQLLTSQTQAACDEIVSQTRDEVDNYWQKLTEKLDAYYQARKGLKEFLGSNGNLL
jgi:hypothetical protein